MSSSSNFKKAMQEVQGQAILGPNVIPNALPYLGGGLVLTALGTYGGLGVIASRPDLFMPTFIGAMIAELVLFFVARGVANQGNNSTALPLLVLYSLLSGYTLSGIVHLALSNSGVGIQGVGIAALGCGVTFIVGRKIGSNLSDKDGLALAQTVRLGVTALLVVLVGQLLLSLFGVYTPSWLEVAISGLGVALFAGVAVVDFYILPRTYKDEQYLPAALSMYLTYINLFVFILRLLLAMNSRD
ncbi:Bax inhibitor-1/YccA family protein [Pleurocapsa sp. FMAR1]|uniref:Bax inhibitor-1/YccA family protein n=1 Tax=Pleurocapsa sp. FMAR1 TaxID=3040204 RepID=UPI0029C967CD|nr:Bax inhibitor-1 family protein [Pleurocapsa sp. FMAR1]